jgi:triphosphoribosyl-dephospho-CoA synthase
VVAELDGLSISDAVAAYRAIAMANPGGLGRAESQDVAEPPTTDLRSAMALAAHRDSIARQYASGFNDLFETGLPASLSQPERGAAADVQHTYLAFLAGWPDSHIVRKLGEAAAHSVMRQAQPWVARAARGEALDADAGFAAWDETLKAGGINPGTSADLTVATLVLALLVAPQRWHGT